MVVGGHKKFARWTSVRLIAQTGIRPDHRQDGKNLLVRCNQDHADSETMVTTGNLRIDRPARRESASDRTRRGSRYPSIAGNVDVNKGRVA